MSTSSLDDTYPASLPSSFKYWFKKISSKVFARDPWESNEQMANELDSLPDLTLNFGTVLVQQDDTECLNMPVDVGINPSSSSIKSYSHKHTTTFRF